MFKPTFNKKKAYIDLSGVKKTPITFDTREGNFSCPSCSAWLSEAVKVHNNDFCPRCGHHFAVGAWERIYSVCDENLSKSGMPRLSSVNPLGFPDYEEKLDKAKEETVLSGAIVTGRASIGEIELVGAALFRPRGVQQSTP